jgi:hypothetical protein
MRASRPRECRTAKKRDEIAALDVPTLRIRLVQGSKPSTLQLGSELEMEDNLSQTPISPMSALGHKQTFRNAIAMSALPPKADMCCSKATPK